MKKGIHPESYRPVVFKDMSNGDMFLSKSTVNTKETIEFEGETYPLLLTRSILVNLHWWIQQVVLISS